jgi:hypothetical protein
MECNDHRLEWGNASEQSRQINKMLNLVNIENIGFGNSLIDAP